MFFEEPKTWIQRLILFGKYSCRSIVCSLFYLHSIIFIGEPTLLSGNEYYFECTFNVSDGLESLLEE